MNQIVSGDSLFAAPPTVPEQEVAGLSVAWHHDGFRSLYEVEVRRSSNTVLNPWHQQVGAVSEGARILRAVPGGGSSAS